MAPPKRPIKRLLVANRGEIAVRVLQAARELLPRTTTTYALHTPNDDSHARHADQAIAVPSPSSYGDIPALISLAKQHGIDAVHPGYGFLSESAEFAARMWEEAGAVVIGPGAEILTATGDKLLAKRLAQECFVPVLESVEVEGSGGTGQMEAFVEKVGYPVMVKAVDGGGGRGIRLIESKEGLKGAVDRAKGESPSGKVFMEKAAVGGFHHVEVQVLGDMEGEVRHLWERDCSVQRRYQKIVEVAPAMMRDRELIGKVIEAALSMAKKIGYLSLGTFEFLVSETKSEFYFLEINPRLQVEHTITECITNFDLVQAQLSIAQGASLKDVGLGNLYPPQTPPPSHSIQLRICAEDPSTNFSLSIGKISEFHVPTGNGIRVEAAISTPPSVIVGSDFDNLLAKVIVTASTWPSTVNKARRALSDVRISGVKTNLDLLVGIVNHPDFSSGRIDTSWLEMNIDQVVADGQTHSAAVQARRSRLPQSSEISGIVPSASTFLFRKGDAWTITLSPIVEEASNSPSKTRPDHHHIRLSRILRNDFPTSLTADIAYTTSPSATQNYQLLLESSTSSAAAASSNHRMGDLSNQHHIVLPMSGKLIEVLIEEGDIVEADTVVAFVKQMKMELEVRSSRRGRVAWVIEAEGEQDGGGMDVREGVLLAELEEVEDGAGQSNVEVSSKL